MLWQKSTSGHSGSQHPAVHPLTSRRIRQKENDDGTSAFFNSDDYAIYTYIIERQKYDTNYTHFPKIKSYVGLSYILSTYKNAELAFSTIPTSNITKSALCLLWACWELAGSMYLNCDQTHSVRSYVYHTISRVYCVSTIVHRVGQKTSVPMSNLGHGQITHPQPLPPPCW